MANATQSERFPGEAPALRLVHGANGHAPVPGSLTLASSGTAPAVTEKSVAEDEDTFVFPASREQTRYWMLAQLDPDSTASNMAIAFEIEGALADPLVEQAIAALTMRHEALRTIFRLEGGVLSQVVLARPLYRFTVEDLTSVAAAEQAQVVEESVSRHGHTLIDLQDGPVLHAHLIHLDEKHHVIALTMNHIVCDGWSNGILIRDFTLIYEALQAGREAVLPELPFQFADFSIWQNEYLASPAAEEAAAFWKSHVTSDLSALDMPTDHARPSGRSFPGHIESALLPQAIDEQLKAYCRKSGSTKHIVLLAAFEALCATYTGQKQFLLGSTIANRTQPGMEDVVGRFANPQIIVAKVDGDPSFLELEQRVRDWETAAYTHQDLPFSRVIEDFQIDQAGATSQFLQVWFLYQKAFMQPQMGETIRVTPRRSVSGGVDFDLLVSVVERAEGPRIQFEYNTLIFEPERVRGLIESLIQLLGRALENPAILLSEMTRAEVATELAAVALEDGEINQIAADLEGSFVRDLDPEKTGSFLLYIARNAAARPDAVAITDQKNSLTWRQIDEQSSALATALRQKSQPKTAAVHLSPRAESAVALLAAIKLGARVLPLPAHASSVDTAACLRHFPQAVLLAPEAISGNAAFAFESFNTFPAFEGILPLPETHTSFLFLTDAHSGTFAETSGVALLQSVQASLAAVAVDEESSILAFQVSMPTDACVDLLLAVVSGAQFNFAMDSFAAETIASQVAAHEVTCILAKPSQARSILASGWTGDRRVALVLRGERLPTALQTMLTLRLKSASYLLSTPHAPLVAIQALTGEFATAGMRSLGPRGLVLTSAEGAVLPAGAFGEICTGDGLHSGMMARSSSAGVIEPVDAAERYVQLRGHRVCLGDVEDAAFLVSSIAAAAAEVTAAEDDSRLLVYLVGTAGLAGATGSRDTAALRRHFSITLPSHLVPSDFIWLDTLPLLADGRLNTGILPQREPALAAAANLSDGAPLNLVEQRLADIWKEVLGLKSVDVNTSFFALGGSSLLLVRLFARINKNFDTSLPITAIFDARTITALAAVLGGGAEMTHLVQVQAKGAKIPLFMIHSYLLYQGLSMALGNDQPFYGLRELEQDGHLNIEERVKRYVSEIQQVQPQGPYHLAGWCAAGPLTVEVARQLLLSGEVVSYLALFDSWLPGYIESIAPTRKRDAWKRYKSMGSKLTYHRNKVAALGWNKKAMYAWMMVARVAKEAQYRFYLANWERVHRLSVKYHFALPEFMHNTSFETFLALKEYHGERVPVRMTLIRASDSREVHGAIASCGWEQIAEQGVDVLWAPGDHETMFIGERLKITSDMVERGLEAARSNEAQTVGVGQGAYAAAGQVAGALHVDCPST